MIGGTLVRADSMCPEPARRLASVVQPGRRAEVGDALPVLWQWAYFSDAEAGGSLGEDGHPRRDDPWAAAFPRRMAGGGRVRQLAPLVLGQPAERRSVLDRVEDKVGRSGPLVVCDWRHTYLQGGATVLEEVQTLVYRPARSPAEGPDGRLLAGGPRPGGSGGLGLGLAGGQAGGGPGPGVGPEAGAGRGANPATPEAVGLPVRRLSFGPVLLFRFSAATWNSHRVHYDRDYARAEGYPGLLVQGPLLALLLSQEAERALGRLRVVEFRAQSPVFDTDTVEVYLSATAGSCRVEARKQDGTLASALVAWAGEV